MHRYNTQNFIWIGENMQSSVFSSPHVMNVDEDFSKNQMTMSWVKCLLKSWKEGKKGTRSEILNRSGFFTANTVKKSEYGRITVFLVFKIR